MNATSRLQALLTQDSLRALSARAPRYVAIILVLALAAQAAVLLTDFAASSHSTPLRAGGGPSLADTRKRFDIAGLVNAHLFGAASVAGTGDAEHAPATSMSLVLAGVLASEDPSLGTAILGEAAKSAKVYTVGQSVPGGAKLHAVYDDRVILDRNGAFESLLLPRGVGKGGKGAPLAMAPLPTANPIDTMRRVIVENPGAMTDILRPTPVFVQGKQQGFRLYPGRNRAAFSHLGLQSGDLVTAINGTPLDDPGRSNEIMNTLSSSSEAHVTITRNGLSQDLVLNLAQVAADAQSLAVPPVGGGRRLGANTSAETPPATGVATASTVDTSAVSPEATPATPAAATAPGATPPATTGSNPTAAPADP